MNDKCKEEEEEKSGCAVLQVENQTAALAKQQHLSGLWFSVHSHTVHAPWTATTRQASEKLVL